MARDFDVRAKQTNLTQEFGKETTRSPKDLDTEIGRRMRQARLLAGISQDDLGKAVGVRFQQIQKYETGTNRVSASTLNTIAQTLGKPVAYFYGKQNEEVSPTLSKEETALIRDYRALSPEKQEAVSGMVSVMVSFVGPKASGPR